MKKKKRNPIKALKTKAWTVFARWIRARDGMCVTCHGSPDHCGHFIRNSERNQSLGGNELWYDPRNFGGQCVGCNLFKSGEAARFAIHLEAKYGFGIVQELHALAQRPKKWTAEEVERVIATYS